MDVRQWFDHAVPRPLVPSNWVNCILKARHITDNPKAERRCVWIGEQPKVSFTLPSLQAMWLHDLLEQSTPGRQRRTAYPLLREIKTSFPKKKTDFESLLRSSAWKRIRAAGLLLV
jgi:hypothetical protein